MRVAIWALGIVLSFSPAVWATNNSADVDVFLDYPAGAWADASLGNPGTYTLNATSPVHDDYATRPDNRSIDAQLTEVLSAPSFQPTRIQFEQTKGGQVTTRFTHVEFWVHGGSGSGQQFLVYAGVLQPGAPFASLRPPVSIAPYGSVQSGAWTRIRIPLAALGVAQGERLQIIGFRAANGSTVPRVWLDEVRMVRTPPMATYVDVDAGSVVTTFTASHFGVNVAAWDPDLTFPTTAARLVEGGVTWLRFPGGSVADRYDWQTNRDKHNTALYPGIDCHFPSVQPVQTYYRNSGEFVQVANAVGAEKFISVNYGSGTPMEAADWVRAANVFGGSNIRYWAVGNEPYGSWECDTRPAADRHRAVRYAEFVQMALAQMKAADGSIRVGVAGTHRTDDYPQINDPVPDAARPGFWVNGWSPVMLARLRQLGVVPDFYELHVYSLRDPRHENDGHALRSSDELAAAVASARQLLVDYLGPAGATVPIVIGETNSVGGIEPGVQTTGIVNGLYLVDALLKSVGAGAHTFGWWNLRNGATTAGNNNATLFPYQGIGAGNFGLINGGGAYPAFYALKLLKQFARPGDRLIRVAPLSGYAPPGQNDEGILFPTHASLSADGRMLRVLILSRTAPARLPWESYPQYANIRLRNFTPVRSRVSTWSGGEVSIGPWWPFRKPGMGDLDVAYLNIGRYGAHLVEFER